MTFTIPIRLDSGGTDAAISKVTSELDRLERTGKAAGEIVSKALASGKLHADQAAEATRRYAVELANAERAAERAAQATAKIQQGGLSSFVGSLQSGVGRLTEFGANVSLVAGGVTSLVSGFASAAMSLADWGAGLAFANDGLIQMRNRLRNVTQGYAELQSAMDLTLAIANRTRTDWGTSLDVYARVANVTNGLGFSMDRTGRFAETLTKMFAASGRSAGESGAAMLQFSQALGSGRLQGDEFRSIAENMPSLLDAFAAKLGTTRGALKDLASQGKITTDVMIAGVEDMANKADAAFNRMEQTFSQRMQPTLNALKQDPFALNKAVTDPTALWGLAGKSPTEFAEGLGLSGAASAIGADFANQTIKISEFNKEIGRMTMEISDLAKAMGGAASPAAKGWTENLDEMITKAREATPSLRSFNEVIADAKSKVANNVDGWAANFNSLGTVLDGVWQKADSLISKLAGIDSDGYKLISGLFGQNGVDILQQLSVAGEQAEGGWASTRADPLELGKRRGGGRARAKPWTPETNFWGNLEAQIRNAAGAMQLFDFWAGDAAEQLQALADQSEKWSATKAFGVGQPGGGDLLNPFQDPNQIAAHDPAMTAALGGALKNRIASNDNLEKQLKAQAEQYKLLQDIGTTAAKGIEDAFVKLAMTGEFSFKGMANAILADLTRMATHRLLMSLLGAALGPAPAAAGAAAFAHGGSVVPRAAHGDSYRIGGSSTVGDKVPFFAWVNSGERVDISNRFQQAQGGGAPPVNVKAVVQQDRRGALLDDLDTPDGERRVVRIMLKHLGRRR